MAPCGLEDWLEADIELESMCPVLVVELSLCGEPDPPE